MTVPNEHLLVLAACLFAIGVAGFFLRRNVIVVLMSIELMLNAANLTFIAGSRMHSLGAKIDLQGPVFVIFVIVVAAIEVVPCSATNAYTATRNAPDIASTATMGASADGPASAFA